MAEKRVCGAKRRSDGNPCQCAPLKGANRCKRHGGASLKGSACPSFKTGRYSRALGAPLAESVARLANDRELLSLRSECSLAIHRVEETLAEALDPQALKTLRKAVEEAQTLLAGDYDAEDLEAALTGLLDAATAIGAKSDAGRELERRLETLRKLTETENRREAFLQAHLPAEQARSLFEALKASFQNRHWQLMRFLRESYPEVIQDRRMPAVLHLVQQDVNHLFGTFDTGPREQPALIKGEDHERA